MCRSINVDPFARHHYTHLKAAGQWSGSTNTDPIEVAVSRDYTLIPFMHGNDKLRTPKAQTTPFRQKPMIGNLFLSRGAVQSLCTRLCDITPSAPSL